MTDKAHSCIYCVYHRAEQVAVIEEDGVEKPIFRHYCHTASGERIQQPIELDFGCGLWTERTL